MYGLLGKKLSHSFSKEIHEYFIDSEYTLFESDDLKEFFTNTSFLGLNVTIPYKNEVIKYLDQLSPEAEAIGAANTISRSGGKLTGYNTDYFGLQKALEINHISVSNQDIIILGNGSTSRTIEYYCRQNFANNIWILARNPKENEHHFSSVENFSSATIVFNATPVGMFPHNDDDLLINLYQLPKLNSLIDVIYNPLRSNVIIEAQSRGIKTVNGLFMLISQAVKSIELFHNITIPDQKVIDYYQTLNFQLHNLVLIGMPMSGKTYFGQTLSKLYDKTFIDIDHEIEESANMSIEDIFKTRGERSFRRLESEHISKHSKGHNKAISCGGGAILNSLNVQHLKQNGVILFIDVPLSLLKTCNPKNRPLLRDKRNLENLYHHRYPIYKQAADIIINKTSFNQHITLEEIEVKLHEYFNS